MIHDSGLWESGCPARRASYPERHLNVLAAPDFHLLVVAPNVVEVFFRDRKEATGKCGRPEEEHEGELKNKDVMCHMHVIITSWLIIYSHLMG